MKNPLYKEFVALQAKKEEIDSALEVLRAKIVGQLMTTGIEKEKTVLGTFTVATRVNWEYSPAIDALKEKMRLAQIKEQKKGIAEKHETHYLRFTPPTTEE